MLLYHLGHHGWVSAEGFVTIAGHGHKQHRAATATVQSDSSFNPHIPNIVHRETNPLRDNEHEQNQRGAREGVYVLGDTTTCPTDITRIMAR